MDTLEQARAEIDAVDAQLAALFERRMAAVLSVAQYKQAHGLPVYDAAREAVVLEKAAARIQDPALRPYYRDHVQNMMDVAKQYEAEVLGENRAAYQGVEGAFAHIALRALFPHAEAVSYPTWDEVFEAVRRGDAAHGVVPFENSHAGDVSAVLDLCYNYPELWVVDVYDLPISQNLLVLPGTQLAQLRHVYSHQQAIAQSETFLKQFHLPATAMPNTAMAAKFVAESGDPSQAAIASAETAALYGLEVLVPSINTDGDNTTRFIVLSREKPTGGNRFSLLFTLDNKPGKLAEVIQVIGRFGYDMESIKSRPLPHVPFDYYFYVELVGDPADDETAALPGGRSCLCVRGSRSAPLMMRRTCLDRTKRRLCAETGTPLCRILAGIRLSLEQSDLQRGDRITARPTGTGHDHCTGGCYSISAGMDRGLFRLFSFLGRQLYSDLPAGKGALVPLSDR